MILYIVLAAFSAALVFLTGYLYGYNAGRNDGYVDGCHKTERYYRGKAV